jgi:hypothetical protein
MSTTVTDTEAITAKVNLYVKGCQTGDGALLAEAFHPDARMFGAVGPDRYDIPVLGGMDAAMAETPTVDHDADILSVDVEGDAACVKVAEARFWGQGFVDYFLLSRIDGEWQIVAKAFNHTGPSD